MKLARINYQGEVCEATVTSGGYLIEKPSRFAGTVVGEHEARLLPPAAPGKILGVGWNFREHIREMVGRSHGVQLDEQRLRDLPHPLLFLKPPSSLIGHRDTILYPFDATRVEHEGEIAVVISRDARRVTPEEARDVVLGWTCANDVTERDQQGLDKQWWRAKGYDTFAVAGPCLETEYPGPDAWLRCRVNGEVRQEAQLSDMIRDPFTIIAIASQAMTLNRGDMIMLGTPSGVGELHPGDEVEVEIDGIGRLSNPVELERA